ncbi:MAG: hypothetical protein OEV60_01850 [Actinomycetota bacterium]|nr:hypothetical protein [Actinomycetota bacterium]MDH5313996.1 hypothetical protein [Actinomycetota bacterium]
MSLIVNGVLASWPSLVPPLEVARRPREESLDAFGIGASGLQRIDEPGCSRARNGRDGAAR